MGFKIFISPAEAATAVIHCVFKWIISVGGCLNWYISWVLFTAQQANILSKYTINGLNDLFADIEMNKDKRKGNAVVRRNLRFEHNWSSNRSNHTEFKTTVRSSMLFEQRFCSNSSFVQIMVYQWERIFYYLSFTDWSYVSSKYRFAIDQPRLG